MDKNLITRTEAVSTDKLHEPACENVSLASSCRRSDQGLSLNGQIDDSPLLRSEIAAG